MACDRTTARHRFYCPDLDRSGGDIVQLDADQARHAVQVLRLTAGETVDLFDGAGRVGRGVVARVGKREMAVALGVVEQVAAPVPMVTVAAAVPKGPRAEDMVNQLVQVGADRWVPLVSERAAVDPRVTKLDRLGRVALDAARQCGRAWTMRIDRPMNVEAALAIAADVRLIGVPDAPAAPPQIDTFPTVVILIGPEGGWTAEELELAARAGAVPWRFGPHVMRIETAAVVAVALVRAMTLRL